MNFNFALEPLQIQFARSIQELEYCNNLTVSYGLSLSLEDMKELVEHRFVSLKNTGRIEFGEGIFKKLVYNFCDSPYLSKENYKSTLMELQEMFYYFKGESMECFSDDELIGAMKLIFNEEAHGSIEYLSGISLSEIINTINGKNDKEHWEKYLEGDEYE